MYRKEILMSAPAKAKSRCVKALTLLEMVIALSIVSILFAVIMPVFTNARNSWDSRQCSSQAIQNGRVLVDYLYSQLAKAVKITNVSGPFQADGFIEFEDASGKTLRFDIAANNYVQFGQPGAQSELAGPVSKLQFTCYALDNLNTPTTDAEKIRFVKVEAVLDNVSANGHSKTFKTSAYLQTNGTASTTSQLITYDCSIRKPGTDIFGYSGEPKDARKIP